MSPFLKYQHFYTSFLLTSNYFIDLSFFLIIQINQLLI